MRSAKLYRLEVAPLVILPLTRTAFFSYLSFGEIASGSYVSIPFGKRIIEGVVFDCTPLPGRAPAWMKFVNRIIEKKFLTKEQLELARYVSEEYFTPLGKTLKHFLPHRAQAKKKRSENFSQTIKKLATTKKETKILKLLTASKNNLPLFINTAFIENPYQLFIHLAQKIVSLKKQAIFLIPETTLLPELEASFLQYFHQEKIAVLSSQLSKGAYFEAWEKIRSGDANIILSTRQGLFAPFKNLCLITLLEEQDESYKQWDMSPRYHSKRVAEHLSELHSAKFLLASGTPSMESYYHIKNKRYVPLVPISYEAAFGKNIEIVNLRLERFKKNYSPLSRSLVDAIRSALNEKKQILLYIHRQGVNAFSVCENCKNILRCPKSGHTLTATQDGAFRCLSCGYKTGSFPNCPHCGHLSFRHIGFGTERIEREIEKLFPTAKVFRADGSTMRTLKNTKQLYEKISRNRVDILIGTQMILKGPTLPKLALVGMIDADSLLAFPDFRADEKLFHILTRAAKKAKVVVQTFHPENVFFQKVTNLGLEEIIKQMLAEREDLFYPPFSRMISIACQGETKEQAEAEARVFYNSLKKLFPKGSKYRLNAPQPPVKKPGQKMFRSILLLRSSSKKNLDKKIKQFLIKNSVSSIIDVDPISLF